jgi:enterochelin esterase-like enzyme
MIMRRCIVLSVLALLCLFPTGFAAVAQEGGSCLKFVREAFDFLTGFATVAQEGRIVRETVYSPSLKGNLLRDSPYRPVTIYLPPSYDAEPDMFYPVVYLLHGYGGNDKLWIGGSYTLGNIVDSMESWLKSGKVKEMILVMPNSFNAFGGSYYTNSAATGNWADFIAKDLVDYIDSHYRTLPVRESRAVIGHSMGGYGGVTLGMLYPEVFGCMGGMAGVYLIDGHLRDQYETWAYTSTIENWAQFWDFGWGYRVCIAWNAIFAPNPDNPPFYGDSPFVYSDAEPGKIVEVEDAYAKFLEHDTLRMADGHLDALLDMRCIYIDCGTHDGLLGHARELHEKLESLGVRNVYKEHPGRTHLGCVMASTGDALEVFSDAMQFYTLVGVEPAGKLATTWGKIRAAE